MRLSILVSSLSLILLMGAFGTVGASGAEPRKAAPFALPQPKKSWTVLLYLSGDNNLDGYTRNILKRAERAGSSQDVHVVAQIDGRKDRDSKRLYLRYNAQGKPAAISLKSSVEFDMGSPEALADFVDWGIRNFPSQRTVLMITAHGRGILNLPVEDGSFTGKKKLLTLASSPDDTSGTHMDEEDMAASLGRVLQPRLPGGKLDLVLYNSCMMGNMEVLRALSGVAHYAMASEYTICVTPDADLSTELGVGAPIESVIRNLSLRPAITVEALGELALQQFDDSYRQFGRYHEAADQYEYCKSSFALYDLSQARRMSGLIRRMVQDFRNYRPSGRPAMERLYRAFLKEPLVDSLGYTDLGIVSGRLCEVTGSPAACELRNSLYADGGFIMSRRMLHNPDSSAGAGVSIFFPAINAVDAKLKEFTGFYSRLRFSEETGWGSLVLEFRKYLGAHRFEMLRSLVAEAQSGRIPQVSPGRDLKYSEYMLYLMATNAFNEALEKGDLDEALRYVEQLAGGRHRTPLLKKHREDLRATVEERLTQHPQEQATRRMLQLLRN